MWANAVMAHIRQHPHVSNGWNLVEGHYTPVFHEGLQMPKTLVPQQNDLMNSYESDDEGLDVSSADESDYSENDVL